MERIIKVLFWPLILFNFLMAAWFLLHGDIQYSHSNSLIFLLLNELDAKKIVLLGPSSTTGLFHGPLWTYVNYPFYLLGKGDPVIVGWGWFFMVVAATAAGFYMAKDLFGEKTAYLFTLMSTLYWTFHVRGFFNPHGAMLIIPAFFYLFIKYIRTLKPKFLAFNVLITGAIIQFQMAIGVPFLILSFLYLLFFTYKHKKLLHLLFFLLTFISISNFVIFDLRHNFLLSKLFLHFSTSAGRDHPNIIAMLYQRIQFMTGGIEFLRTDPGGRNLIIFLISSVFLFFQIKDKKFRKIYYLFLYFYFGYLILSNLNAGGLLYFYLFPLFPLVFLIFSSFITSRLSKAFVFLFFILMVLNTQNAMSDTFIGAKYDIGRRDDSWLLYRNLAQKVFGGKEKEFGYFVYTPDILAYEEKYALGYISKNSDKKAYYFQKKPITYLIVAPPPRNNPFMKPDWWKENMWHVSKKPVSIENLSSGFKIEKYNFSDEEIKVAPEKGIDPGIALR